MADAYAYITFALEEIEQILIDNRSGTLDHLLKNHLEMMKALLIEYSSRKSKGWQKHMREVINETEDIIDSYFLSQSTANTYIPRRWRNRIHLAKEIKNIREQHMEMVSRLAERPQSDNRNEAQSRNDVDRITKRQNQKIIVGFEDFIEELMEDLHENREKLDVLTIIGMPGLGKTTVASKIFHDPSIIDKFPTRIWVNLSENQNMRDIYATILKEVNPKDVSTIMEEDGFMLKQQVYKNLNGVRFLMVLDGISTCEAWEYIIEPVLPVKNKKSKVLLTSRDDSVALCANLRKIPCHLRFLTNEESWKLLQFEVYGEEDVWPHNQRDIGEEIAKRCDGLPLALVAAARILKETLHDDSESESIWHKWTMGSHEVMDYMMDKEPNMSRIIALSYDKMPHYLKECFLYLGVFPEHFEIPVWKLIRLWIAEGFIQEVNNGTIIEDIAMEYLQNLITRNLVMTHKENAQGNPKTCHIHSVVRAFCKKEAREIGLFQEIMMTSTLNIPEISKISKFHRLCVHSHVMEFFNQKPKGPHTRSFLCFNNDEQNFVWPENSSNILHTFDLLRIFEGNSIIFPEYPTKLKKLIHLKYIMLAMDGCILPKQLSNLRNLQTLVILTSSPTVEIKVDISNMGELRHLKTKAAITLAKNKKCVRNLNLQTMSRISMQSCSYEILKKFPYLKTLGICGKIIPPFDQHFLQKLDSIEKLKIYHDSKTCMIRWIFFPACLKMLTLSETKYPWTHMAALSQLVNLEFLKLKENAFKGAIWNQDEDGFVSLHYLQIESPEITKWTASNNAFPKLVSLVLKDCRKLNALPPGLWRTLQNLTLQHVNQHVVTSARDIERAVKENRAREWGGFKLIIAPKEL